MNYSLGDAKYGVQSANEIKEDDQSGQNNEENHKESLRPSKLVSCGKDDDDETWTIPMRMNRNTIPSRNKNRSYRIVYPVRLDRRTMTALPAAKMMQRWDATKYTQQSSMARQHQLQQSSRLSTMKNNREQQVNVEDVNQQLASDKPNNIAPIYYCTPIEQVDLIMVPNWKCITISIVLTILWYLVVLLLVGLIAWACQAIVALLVKNENATSIDESTERNNTGIRPRF
jgi:hypothetical protein